MSPQTLAGICGGVTIRVANHTTTAIDTDVTNMKATIGIWKMKILYEYYDAFPKKGSS